MKIGKLLQVNGRVRKAETEGKHLKAIVAFCGLESFKELIVVVSVFLLGFFFFLWVFLRNQLVPMIDCPYYLIQVRGILTTGGLIYGDPPLTFYLLALFSLISGDIMLGVKVGTAFLSALSLIPAYFLMKRVGRSIFAGTTAMLFVIFSAPYIRMLSDFIKNAVGVCWLFAFIYYLHDLAISGFKKSSLALATFFLILTGLTHILDFGVALLFLAFYALTVLIFNDNRRPFLKALSVIALATCVFVLIAAIFFSALFTDFSKFFSFIGDLTALEGDVSNSMPTPPPRPSSAMSYVPSVASDPISAFLFPLGAILSFYAWRKKEKEVLLLLSVTTIVGFILCFPFIPTEWLIRLQLMIVVPTAIILSCGISKIWSCKGKQLVAFVLLIAVLSFYVMQTMNTIAVIRPTISEEGYLDLVEIKKYIPSNSTIAVYDYGIRYWVEYVDEVDVIHENINELPPELWQSYSHVLGIFFKEQVPQIPFKTIFVGNVYVLAELQQSNSSKLQ